jgi:hypothetical protein
MKTLCFDIDGTICTQTLSEYALARPIDEAREVINRLYDEGFRIVFCTSRFMGRNHGDAARAHAEGYEFTKKQLDAWGFKYHELIMGKPMYHILVDDKSLFFKADWDIIYATIKEKAREDIH